MSEADPTLTVTSTTQVLREQGVLVVTGTLFLTGNASFNGLVLVIDQGTVSESGALNLLVGQPMFRRIDHLRLSPRHHALPDRFWRNRPTPSRPPWPGAFCGIPVSPFVRIGLESRATQFAVITTPLQTILPLHAARMVR